MPAPSGNYGFSSGGNAFQNPPNSIQAMLSKIPSQPSLMPRSNSIQNLQSPMGTYLPPMSNYRSQNQHMTEAERKKQERERRIQTEKEELRKLENYNPFGKAGAGAPLKDNQGNVVTNRKAVGFVDQQNNSSNSQLANNYSSTRNNPNTYSTLDTYYTNYSRQPVQMPQQQQPIPQSTKITKFDVVTVEQEEKRKQWQAELREQMLERKEKNNEEKRRQKMEDQQEEQRIKQELEDLNDREKQVIAKERGGANISRQGSDSNLVQKGRRIFEETANAARAASLGGARQNNNSILSGAPGGVGAVNSNLQPSYELGNQHHFVMDGNRGMIHSRSEVQVGLGLKGQFKYDTQRQGYDPRDVQLRFMQSQMDEQMHSIKQQMKLQSDALNKQLNNLRTEAAQIKQGTRAAEKDLQRIQDHINSNNDWHSYYEQEFSKALNMPLFNKNRQQQRQVQFQSNGFENRGAGSLLQTSSVAALPNIGNTNEQTKWVNLLQRHNNISKQAQLNMSRQSSASRESQFPQSKGHVLKSAAATLFDGKPPLKFLQNGADSWDPLGGVGGLGGFNELITDTKIVPVDQFKSVYQPDFNKVQDESMALEHGVGVGMITRDREYFEQAHQELKEIEELNKLSEITHLKEENHQMKRYASQAVLNQKLKTIDVTSYKPPKIASYKGIQERLKREEEVRDSNTLMKDLINQPLMNHNGKQYDPQAMGKIVDERAYNKMEAELKAKQNARVRKYEQSTKMQIYSKDKGLTNFDLGPGGEMLSEIQSIHDLGGRQESAQSALRALQESKHLNGGGMDEDDDYWGRDIQSKNQSEREPQSGFEEVKANNQGGGFVSGMYEKSLKNQSELVLPPNELDYD